MKLGNQITKTFVFLHKWTGFVLSILFLIWFISGFVMMYKDFPYLRGEEILEKSGSIKASMKVKGLEEILPEESLEEITTVQLIAYSDRPVYRLKTNDGIPMAYFADSGEAFEALEKEVALQIIREFEQQELQIKRYNLNADMDQWTPRTRFVPYMPLHRIQVDDGRGTEYYVSAVNGEILQKLNTSDKVWAWLGAIPHWIYFRDLRVNTPLWRAVVIALSLIGLVMSLLGFVLGFIRYQRSRGMYFSPYKKRWFKWHHYIGFAFGLFVCTWILSGLFSMNPWHWSPETNLDASELRAWRGESFHAGMTQTVSINDGLNALAQKGNLKEISIKNLDGKLVLQGQFIDRKPVMVFFEESKWRMEEKASLARIRQKILELPGIEAVSSLIELDEYDNYYVDKWNRRPLPVYKAETKGLENPTIYVDPHTQEVLKKYVSLSRWNRWLYNGLHSFDLPILLKRRPLWDIIVWFFMLGGTAVSVTGVVLTWKWIKRKAKKGRFGSKSSKDKRLKTKKIKNSIS